jgi:hypothetical protein
MILLLMLATWSFVLILVAALCIAARRGDLEQEVGSPSGEARPTYQPVPIRPHARACAQIGQPAKRLVGGSARGGLRLPRTSGLSPVIGGGAQPSLERVGPSPNIHAGSDARLEHVSWERAAATRPGSGVEH